MNFIVRPVEAKDLSNLESLAGQFSLLNLPANKKVISEKIELSKASFLGEASIENATYMFVTEDLENGWVVGSAQIKAQHGSNKNPTYSYKLLKKEMFSKTLGVGFIHQVLKLQVTTEGPTELGGLVVHKGYRRRPEKVGKLTSLSRFLFIGMEPGRFKAKLHTEMAPPLTEDGRSEFWEALGRRYTGMSYQEADALSHKNKEFIESLFPKEEIYLALLDTNARMVLGRVSDQTAGALHLLSKIGFKDKNEVDPFDGGPHLGIDKEDVTLVKNGKKFRLGSNKNNNKFEKFGFIGFGEAENIKIAQSPYIIKGDEVVLPDTIRSKLDLDVGVSTYLTHE